ncbi:MAG: hypothetical protein PHW32_00715 [Bacilli bacterium]|nr:hypothetical protein [Bacilli bacterium]MDD4282170.1 hypothetical protein [Bacilli bacterium]MDD4718551.1 hypothetical protein [Bacilli bacterium]
MSERDIDKAINESIANVETENTYHIDEEIKEIKDSIRENKNPNKVLKNLVDLHNQKGRKEQNDKRTR